MLRRRVQQVPDIDQPSGGYPNDDGRSHEIELRILDANAKSRENLNREADQRYYLRWIAVVIVIMLIVGMGAMLWHTTHQLFASRYFEQPAAYVVAVYVAPIASVTALALGLLVAAFRGFKKEDASSGAEAITSAAKSALDGGS